MGQEFIRDPDWISADEAQWRDDQIAEARRLSDAGEFADARAALNAVKERFPTNTEVDRIIVEELSTVDDDEQAHLEAVAVAEAERRSSRRSRRRDRDPEPEAETETETATEASETETEPEEEESIRAQIVTVRDRGAGEGTTLILTGCGTSSRLSEGDRGRVTGTSHRATITRITGGNSCEAESSGSPGEIRSAGHVTF